MRRPLLDAVRGLDPAAGAPDIDSDQLLERIRARAGDPATADVTHLVPHPRSRPARRIAMGAAALSAIVAVALVLTLTQRGPQAYAGWQPEPTAVSPATAAERCPDVEPGPPPVPVEPVLGEQRGSYRFAVLAGEGVFVECLTSDALDEPFVVAQGTQPADPAAFELGDAPAVVLSPGGTWASEGGEGPITTVIGLAAPEVSEILLTTTDGTVAEATITGGWWAVWFPGEVEISDDLRLVTPEGELTLSLSALVAPGVG